MLGWRVRLAAVMGKCKVAESQERSSPERNILHHQSIQSALLLPSSFLLPFFFLKIFLPILYLPSYSFLGNCTHFASTASAAIDTGARQSIWTRSSSHSALKPFGKVSHSTCAAIGVRTYIMASSYSSGVDTQTADLRRRNVNESSSTTTLSTKDVAEKSKQKVRLSRRMGFC